MFRNMSAEFDVFKEKGLCIQTMHSLKFKILFEMAYFTASICQSGKEATQSIIRKPDVGRKS